MYLSRQVFGQRIAAEPARAAGAAMGLPYPPMKRAILAAAVIFSAARCATMVNTANEKIPVRSNPAGAVVSVDCGNAPLYGGVTPTTITVPRTAAPCSITLAKEGYVPVRVDFHRELSRAVAANKVAAAPVGFFAAILGYALSSATSFLDPDQIAANSYDAATTAAAIPANKFDESHGGAYKQVPGEVDVTLDPEPTTPSPPR